ncbi:MAG: hypothetical protein K0U54_07290, partial [Bacteroidetes bacterium]|nr:hypothetical protein [Bacteroidota bacterium]
MNTYDDNLHSTVVSSLTAQELEIKKINAQLTASMFKLYYAEGSRITASDKLEKAKKDLKKKTAVKKQAVKNSNISTNMLMSATQSKAYVDQSTTNSAVGAANVQIAANAILKLAGDMGNIYSIVSAADYDTEIFEHSKEAYSLMNTTAYHAEKVSQHAMEASYLTAEVSMNTVSDKAKGANNAMKEMLKVADSDFAKSSETVAQDNEKYAVASTKEQASEGELEDVNVEFTATKSAYGLMNKELNLNLLVNPNTVTSNQFTLSFSALKSPFNPPHMASDDDDKKAKTSGIQDLVSPKRQKGSGFLRLKLPLGYPVETYSAIIVKSEKKGTFTISDAENIIQKNSRWFTKISPVETIPPKKKTGKPTVKARHKIEETIQIFGKLDSDGDKIVCGQDYVVFIMAEYVKEYKRLINNFDNYLSAPSPEFCMTYALVAPDYGTFSYIKTTPGPAAPSSGKPSKGDPGKDIKDGDGVTDTTPKQMTSFFNFQTAYAENQGMEVQYRCMFLAAGEKIIEGLLTVNGLKTIE